MDLIGRRAVAADMRARGRAMSFAVVADAERVRGYLGSAGRLGVPYGTYRRRLALAKERLVEQLLRQMA
jgi:hypothetical protein